MVKGPKYASKIPESPAKTTPQHVFSCPTFLHVPSSCAEDTQNNCFGSGPRQANGAVQLPLRDFREGIGGGDKPELLRLLPCTLQSSLQSSSVWPSRGEGSFEYCGNLRRCACLGQEDWKCSSWNGHTDSLKQLCSLSSLSRVWRACLGFIKVFRAVLGKLRAQLLAKGAHAGLPSGRAYVIFTASYAASSGFTI